jgi:hypothetical protein
MANNDTYVHARSKRLPPYSHNVSLLRTGNAQVIQHRYYLWEVLVAGWMAGVTTMDEPKRRTQRATLAMMMRTAQGEKAPAATAATRSIACRVDAGCWWCEEQSRSQYWTGPTKRRLNEADWPTTTKQRDDTR